MPEQIENKEKWNALALQNPAASGAFLGSWEWGEFQKSFGRKAHRFFEDGKFAQIIEHTLPFGGKYWFSPRGSFSQTQKGAEISSLSGIGFPVTKDGSSPSFPFYHELSEYANEKGMIFWRFEPMRIEEIPEGAQKSVSISPPATLILNLTKSEDEFLAGMHEKTRYNIRLASRKGVKCQMSGAKWFDDFWKLLRETAKRDGFRTHPRAYYEKMLEIPWIELWTAEWQSKILAAGIWSYFAGTATYLHGASSREHRNFMAPHLLHWEVMRDAKRRGLKVYDFWGIDPSGKGAWSGITRFKFGFGGRVLEFPGTYDLPIRRFWYNMYRIVRNLRRG